MVYWEIIINIKTENYSCILPFLCNFSTIFINLILFLTIIYPHLNFFIQFLIIAFLPLRANQINDYILTHTCTVSLTLT